MKKLIIASFFWLSIALSAPQAAPQDVSITPPSPTGAVHACGAEWYPPAALGAGEEGKTTVSFRVGVDGSTKSIFVATTSGFADLDEAATKCVATWKYQPAMQSGRALEVDWKANVEWSLAAAGKVETVTVTRGSKPPQPSAIAPTQQPIGSHVCKNPMDPPAPLGKMSIVSFYIHRDGSVDHIKLFRSSGDDNLDELALKCASDWRFTPLPDDAPRVLIFSISRIPW